MAPMYVECKKNREEVKCYIIGGYIDIGIKYISLKRFRQSKPLQYKTAETAETNA